MNKKIRAFLLAAMMVVSILPIMSMAADVGTEDALRSALQENAQIKLTDSFVAEGVFNVPDGVVIDGNNKTITVNSLVAEYFLFRGNNFTVKNLTIINHGTTNNTGAFSMNTGKLENVTVDGGVFGVKVGAGSGLVITGCTFENQSSYAVYLMENGSSRDVEITKTAFNSTRSVILRSDETFTGNIVAGDKGVSVATADATITGNDFSGTRALSLSGAADGTGITGNNIKGYVEVTSPTTLSGNYWTDEAKTLSPEVTTSNDLEAPVEVVLPSAPAPVYGGPVMNWVKVNAAENGVVKSGPLAASAGATVTLYPKAAAGYVLDTVEVLDAEGNALELDGLKFQIPLGGVTVNATFKLAE